MKQNNLYITSGAKKPKLSGQRAAVATGTRVGGGGTGGLAAEVSTVSTEAGQTFLCLARAQLSADLKGHSLQV